MKNNIIDFPGTSDPSEEDDFCGADGFGLMFRDVKEGGKGSVVQDPSLADTIEFNLLPSATQEARRSSHAEIEFGDEVDTTELKAALLRVLQRRKKEHLREGYLLTVVHPDFGPEEQVPFLIQHGETPSLSIQRATPVLREEMCLAGGFFPQVRDAKNAIGSSIRNPEPEYFF